MRHLTAFAFVALWITASRAQGYIEASYSLGQICNESTHIVLVEVSKVNKEKNLIIFRKVQDLKGQHPHQEIKHNIGQRGRHPREWQTVMAWAEAGKTAVFFHNGSASVTCTGTHWYQCFPEGEWWGMSHGEPFLLRTYFGPADRLAAAVSEMQQGREVTVPCLAAGSADQLHEGKGQVQRLKASLKRLNYDSKRDFVALGAGEEKPGVEQRTVVLLARGTADWKFVPEQNVAALGNRWKERRFDDTSWRSGKAPIGYGEDEIRTRSGTLVSEQGVPFVFRRVLEIPADLLNHPDVKCRMRVASDDSATIYVNGAQVDQDPADDHEYGYWNREITLRPSQLTAGRNVIAAHVRNKPGSSDIYLDMEVSAHFPLPASPVKLAAAQASAGATPAAASAKPPEDKERPGALTVDKERRTVTIECAIAPRKLPNLADTYPIEVIATYPAPRGQKAHETVVTFSGVKPSSVHKALEQLGLTPGKPAFGQGTRAQGPSLKISLEFTAADGQARRLPIEQTIVDRKTQQPLGTLKWQFTGSAMKQLDPESDDRVYGADVTGTLMTLLPATNETVIQSNLTAEDEQAFKVDTNKAVLPKEGTAAKLVIELQ